MSAGDKITEMEIAKQQKEIRRIYTQAAKEIRKKTDEFAKRHAQKNAEMMAKKKAGQISEEQYEQWMKGQVFIGEQWETKMKSVARTISDANIEAARLVRTGSLRTLGENMNFGLYELEKHVGVTTFDLYDSRSVSRLIKDSPKLLPEWKINEKKDYKWNYDKVKNSVTQGIIQGEGIPEITKRLTENLQTTNEDRMRLFARTANTSAQNAGRVERLQEAEDEGIKVKKMWVATLDSRTRDDHQYLDGQTVDADEDFITEDGRHIRYPGDPEADPDLVYNCRCTLAYVYDGVNRRSIRRDEDDNAIENMTYREWKEAKENGTLQPNGRLVGDSASVEPARQEQSHVETIRQKVSDHRGDWSTEQLQDVGSDAAQELDSRIAADPPKVEFEKELQNIENDLESLNNAYEQRQHEWRTLHTPEAREMFNKSVREYNEKVIQWQKVSAEQSEYYSRKVSDFLAEVRDVGGVTKETRRQYMTSRTGKAADALTNALNRYPSTWLQKTSESAIPLSPKWTTGRAHYSPWNGEILMDGKIGTGIHEMAHRFERCVPGLLRAEKEFYARRTAGEAPEWLGPGYRPSETTRKDNFVSKYMGKDYGGDAYELASMGIEYLFTKYDTLSKDKDMLKWVLGIITSL